jgi:hypothetical protein
MIQEVTVHVTSTTYKSRQYAGYLMQQHMMLGGEMVRWTDANRRTSRRTYEMDVDTYLSEWYSPESFFLSVLSNDQMGKIRRFPTPVVVKSGISGIRFYRETICLVPL